MVVLETRSCYERGETCQKLCSHRLCPLLYVKVSEIRKQRKRWPRSSSSGTLWRGTSLMETWSYSTGSPRCTNWASWHTWWAGDSAHICWAGPCCVCQAESPRHLKFKLPAVSDFYNFLVLLFSSILVWEWNSSISSFPSVFLIFITYCSHNSETGTNWKLVWKWLLWFHLQINVDAYLCVHKIMQNRHGTKLTWFEAAYSLTKRKCLQDFPLQSSSS